MNENLKGVKKNNVIYEIELDPDAIRSVAKEENPITFDDSHEKGYVNWPLAVDKSYYITHLPSGLGGGNIHHATNFTAAKKYIDWMVAELGDNLLDLSTDENIQKQFISMRGAEDIPAIVGTIPEVNLYNGFSTKPTRWYLKDIKKIVPSDYFTTTVDSVALTINGKILRGLLAKLPKDSLITFGVVGGKRLVGYTKINNITVIENKEKIVDCLCVEYEYRGNQYNGFSGTAHLPNVE